MKTSALSALICVSLLVAASGCFQDPIAGASAEKSLTVSADYGQRYQPPAAKQIGPARLNKATKFRANVDGCDFELIAIGRKARGKFTYWDPQGNPAPTPSGGFGPEGADTILVVRRTDEKQDSLFDAIVPLDAIGNPLEAARTSADWFSGYQGPVKPNPFSSKNNASPVPTKMVSEKQFKLPYAVVRKDGTATFRLDAMTSLVDVVEQIDLAQGSPKSKRYPNLTVAESSSSAGASIEVRYKSNAANDSNSTLLLTAVLRTKDGKDVRVARRSSNRNNSDVTEIFHGAEGRFIALVVEMRRPWPITIEGVPMAPKGLRAPVSVLPKGLSPAKPMAPKVGQPASPANAWRGITAHGTAYSVVSVADSSHSWSPDGIPLYREFHGGVGGTTGGQPEMVSLNVNFDGVLMNDAPGGAELFDDATGKKLPVSLFNTGSSQATGKTLMEASYGIEAAKAPKAPVRIRFYLPTTRYEKLGAYGVASRKSSSPAISDVKIVDEPMGSVMTLTLTHPIVADKNAKFTLRVLADGSYLGYARRIGVKADKLRVQMPAPSTAYKNVTFELARMEAAEIRNVTLRRLAVNHSPK